MNTRFLAQHGIRTPALYDLNNDRGRYGYDFALVEYVDGQKAEAYFQHNNPKDRDALFQRIRDMLTHMHNIQRNVYGNANDNQKRLSLATKSSGSMRKQPYPMHPGT